MELWYHLVQMTDGPTDLVPAPPRDDVFTRIKALVLDSVPSPHSRRAYNRALDDYRDWYAIAGAGQGFNKATVQRYARRRPFHMATRGSSVRY